MATALLAALVVLPACQRESPPPARAMWTAMGTFAAVSLPAARTNDLDSAAATAKSVVAGIEQKLSVYRKDSEISRLNAAAGGEPVPLSADTLALLRRAARYCEASGGAFDPTLGPVIRAWGFSGGNKPSAPLPADLLQRLLDQTGWRNLVISDGTAALSKPGMFLDLGGIAKGYALDKVLESLDSSRYPDVLMDLGGNVRCRGESRPGVPWRIGVRNPFDRNDLLGVLTITSGVAVATSGNYERFVELEGRRYAHIIDPRTGMPVTGMAGVTVVSPDGTESDALSTALFVAGPSAGKQILARLPGNEALFITDEQPPNLLATPGFLRMFKPAPAWSGRIREF